MNISSNPTSTTFNDPNAQLKAQTDARRAETEKQLAESRENRRADAERLESQRAESRETVRANDVVEEREITKSEIDITV